MSFANIPPVTITTAAPSLVPGVPVPPGAAATYTPPAAQLSGSPAQPVQFRISGPFTGLVVIFEQSPDLSGNFANPFPISAVAASSNVRLAGPVSVPDSPPGNPVAAAYYVSPDAGNAVRVRVLVLGAGSPVIDGRTVDFFGSPPGPAPGAFVQSVTDALAIAALGTPADAPAVAVDASLAGTIIAQLRGQLKAQMFFNELFREWKNSHLRELRALKRLVGIQAGAWTPDGDEAESADPSGGN